MLPHDHHDDVLRVGESELLQVRRVLAYELLGACVEWEAYLVLKLQSVVFPGSFHVGQPRCLCGLCCMCCQLIACMQFTCVKVIIRRNGGVVKRGLKVQFR